MQISLVSTVYNEIGRLQATIDSLNDQSLAPSEIIIVDAGSTDGTLEFLNRWARENKAVKVLIKKGCNVAEGRNLAIAEAQHSIIASIDFGCTFHPDWLKSIVTPILEDASVEVVGGAFTVNEENINNSAQKADYVLQNGYQTRMDSTFSVSSRSIAYKKYVWEQIGGYPEWLTLAADDTIFWRQIKQRNFNYVLVDKPFVYWVRHQTFRGFAKEAGRYGLGDGESGINLRTYISHLLETGIRYSIVLHIGIVPFYASYVLWPLWIFVPQLVGLRSYKNAFFRWRIFKSDKYNMGVLLSCFKMIEVSRLSYIRGYTKGLLKRNDLQKTASRKLRMEIS
jgi:glycosyltransferase involved in cell wall biosynthesis